MRRTLLRSDTDPRKPDDKKDLSQYQISETELLLKNIAAMFEPLFFRGEFFDAGLLAHIFYGFRKPLRRSEMCRSAP